MKKINALVTYLLFVGIAVQAQDWVTFTDRGKTGTEIKLISSSDKDMIIDFSVNSYKLDEVVLQSGKAIYPLIRDGVSLLEKGAPSLSRLTKSILIPDKDEMQAEVVSSDYIEINNIDIVPSKGSFNRKIKPESVPYVYGEVYQKNAFFPGKLVDLGDPYILRDFRGQTIYTYPLQYNPVTKTLRIYKNLTVKITSKSNNGKNQYVRERQPEYIDKDFSDTYKNHFLNYQTSRYSPVDEKGKMLIISRADCIPVMQPFVAWKKLKGIQTEIVSIATVGNTSSAILAYIKNYYAANPTLKFVLLVGDYENIISGATLTDPSDNSNKGVSDIYYGQLTGTDSYPEVFVGRFSCSSVADAQTQVDRTIHYERDLKTTDTWLNKAVTFANGETNTTGAPLHYTNMQFLQNIITPYLKSTVYNGSPLCVSVPEFDGKPYASSDPNLTVVIDTLNTGRSTLVQEGEGDYTGFWFSNNTGFTTKNVPSLTNINKLPHVWSVACDVGKFNGQTCFAEALLRSHNGGNTGAITAYMGSCLQEWDPPYDQVDESFSIMTGQQLSTNYKITAGAIAYNGSMKMMDDYTVAQAGPFTSNTLILFGDPSVVLNTTNLAPMMVSHSPIIASQSTNFVVNCNVANALISLTVGGEIIATAYSNGGANSISINPGVNNTLNDTMKVTVTAQNHVTYLGNVLITPTTGINEFSEGNIELFPNPNSGAFDIILNQNYQSATVSILNVLGETLLEKKIADNSSTPIHMDISNLQSGIYFIELKTNESTYVRKIVSVF